MILYKYYLCIKYNFKTLNYKSINTRFIKGFIYTMLMYSVKKEYTISYILCKHIYV